MLEIFVTTLMAFIIAFFAMPVVINIADKKKLFDLPDERKLHTTPIASLGGVGIFLAVVFSCLVGISFTHEDSFQYYFAALFVMFAIGFKDDIIALSATKKFVAQILTAAIIIHLGGVQISSFYGIGGIEELPESLGVPITYFTIILITNAYNLIDGIDGLAGTLGFVSAILFGAYFYLASMIDYAAFSFSLAGALLAFLIFNFSPAKLFMGDSGSLLIGTTLSILVLKFINVAGNPASHFPIESAVALGIAVIVVPLVDTIRAFASRMANGKSPFTPDRNHIHHLLFDRGMTHSWVVFSCVSATLIFVLLTFSFRHLGNFILVVLLFSVSFFALGILFYSQSRRKKIGQKRAMDEQRQKIATKVISIDTKKQEFSERTR